MKNVLITGASRGIGAELAFLYLKNGDEVITIVRDETNRPKLAELKREFPKTLRVLIGDVARSSDLKRIETELSKPIDTLINNAGVYLKEENNLAAMEFEKVTQTFEVNTFAPMKVTQAFLPLLQKSSQSKVVNISSLMGSIQDNTSGGSYAYRMSKTALNMFTKCFSLEQPKIISVTLHPGWVKTDMGGENAPTMPEESASGLWKVIENLSLSDSGKFIDFRGKNISW